MKKISKSTVIFISKKQKRGQVARKTHPSTAADNSAGLLIILCLAWDKAGFYG
jgi:hypothetical protein